MTLDDVDGDSPIELELARTRLVRFLRSQGIVHPEVLGAMSSVPREQFVDDAFFSRSYENSPLPIGWQQTISQPYIVALMSYRLISRSVRRSTVLEIGTGSGYQTAVLSKLYKRVYTIERIKGLNIEAKNKLYQLDIRNVELRYGDGCEGWFGISAFDSIMVTAATDQIPRRLLDQMSFGSCLIAPVGRPLCRLLLVVKNNDGTFTEEATESVRFVPLLPGETE